MWTAWLLSVLLLLLLLLLLEAVIRHVLLIRHILLSFFPIRGICHCTDVAPLFLTALFYICDASIQQPPIYMVHECYWAFIFESCIFPVVTVASLCSVYLMQAHLAQWICCCFKQPPTVRRGELSLGGDGF